MDGNMELDELIIKIIKDKMDIEINTDVAKYLIDEFSLTSENYLNFIEEDNFIKIIEKVNYFNENFASNNSYVYLNNDYSESNTTSSDNSSNYSSSDNSSNYSSSDNSSNYSNSSNESVNYTSYSNNENTTIDNSSEDALKDFNQTLENLNFNGESTIFIDEDNTTISDTFSYDGADSISINAEDLFNCLTSVSSFMDGSVNNICSSVSSINTSLFNDGNALLVYSSNVNNCISNLSNFKNKLIKIKDKMCVIDSSFGNIFNELEEKNNVSFGFNISNLKYTKDDIINMSEQSVRDMSHEEFIDFISCAATLVYLEKGGVLPSLTISQACLESGYGNSFIDTTHNVYGLRGYPGNKPKIYGTSNYLIQFDNFYEATEYHASYFEYYKDKCYTTLLNCCDEGNGLKAATHLDAYCDSGYSDQCVAIIKQYDLTKYDDAAMQIKGNS